MSANESQSFEDDWYAFHESVVALFLDAVAQSMLELLSLSGDTSERERLLEEYRRLLSESLSEGHSYLRFRGENTGRDDGGSLLTSELKEWQDLEILFLAGFREKPKPRGAR